MIYICSFCGSERPNKNSFINHERTCPQNKNRNYKNGMQGKKGSLYPVKNHKCWNRGITGNDYSKHFKNGIGGWNHSNETKETLSLLACNRLQKHSKYSKNIEYKPGVILESSYEVKLAEILDDLNILWVKVRKGFKWFDGIKTRRYIPDFYLPDYDIFLDPKNDYLIKRDEKKIKSAMELNDIKVIVLCFKELTRQKIVDILSELRASEQVFRGDL